MNVADDVKYTETHEWVKKDGDEYVCGISDYAQGELSDVVFVELPDEGKVVEKGDPLCVIESVKAASDIYAPISGTVTAVNEAVADAPDIVNADPYGEAWLCKIAPSDLSELDVLLAPDAYAKHIEG